MKTFLMILTVSVGLNAYARGGHSNGSHSSGHSTAGHHYVRGYTTKRGTYAAPHYQTNPNHTKSDNWSTKGNVNPHTGKAGTKNP